MFDSNDLSSFQLYSVDTRDYSLINYEQEIDLVNRYRSGDKSARDELIKANLRLVRSLAKKHVRSGIDIMDLIQEGNVGLIIAVENYDPTFECRFSTYATFWIKHQLFKFISNNCFPFKLSSHIFADIKKLCDAENKLRSELFREPTIDDIKSATGFSLKKINRLIYVRNNTYLDNLATNEILEHSLMNYITDNSFNPEDIMCSYETFMEFKEYLELLTERKKAMLIYRYGFDDGVYKSLAEVGRKFGITREGARQLEERTLKDIKQYIKKGGNLYEV